MNITFPANRIFSVYFLVVLLSVQACSNENDSTSSTPVETDLPPILTAEGVVQLWEPGGFTRITAGEAGLGADLGSGDRFGRDHDRVGDVNGDGTVDLVVGARSDDDGAMDAGAIYILFMNADGTVNSEQKISVLQGGFMDELDPGSFFGYGVAGIEDYNGDGVPDVAVSAPSAPEPAIYILHLNPDGTVNSTIKNTGIVGQGLSAIGDINRDGRIDLAAADPVTDDAGRVHLLFFDQASMLVRENIVTIGDGQGGFGTGLLPGDAFGGRESALLGDLDGNGTQELAVGAFESDNGLGAIWIVSLDADSHQVVDKRKIAPGLAGFDEDIPIATNSNGTTGGHFGHALVAAGDLNGDAVPDLITSANQYGDGVGYVLYLNADKTVKTYTRIDASEGGFDLTLQSNERFGRSVSIVDDTRVDGRLSVNFGGGAGDTGTLYVLGFDSCDYELQSDTGFWADGVTVFSNWNHGTQTVTGPLTFEQCALKALESDAPNITSNASDGRCVVSDASAVLSLSDEGSSAYVRRCASIDR